MIKYIKKHFGVFYFVAWIVIFFLGGAGALLEWAIGDIPMAIFGLILLPANLISWPVAFGYWETEDVDKPGSFFGKRVEMIFVLLAVTTLLPLAFFFVV